MTLRSKYPSIAWSIGFKLRMIATFAAMFTFLLLLLFVFSEAKSQIIEIGFDKLSVDDIQLDSASLIQDYITALGPPERILRLANTIYVYDKLGIYIYENYKDSNRIVEISIDLKKKQGI